MDRRLCLEFGRREPSEQENNAEKVDFILNSEVDFWASFEALIHCVGTIVENNI